jgi:hypothetical protein
MVVTVHPADGEGSSPSLGIKFIRVRHGNKGFVKTALVALTKQLSGLRV